MAEKNYDNLYREENLVLLAATKSYEFSSLLVLIYKGEGSSAAQKIHGGRGLRGSAPQDYRPAQEEP